MQTWRSPSFKLCATVFNCAAHAAAQSNAGSRARAASGFSLRGQRKATKRKAARRVGRAMRDFPALLASAGCRRQDLPVLSATCPHPCGHPSGHFRHRLRCSATQTGHEAEDQRNLGIVRSALAKHGLRKSLSWPSPRIMTLLHPTVGDAEHWRAARIRPAGAMPWMASFFRQAREGLPEKPRAARRAQGIPRATRGTSPPGGLFFGDFLLATQKKVTRRRAREPAPQSFAAKVAPYIRI